MKRNALATLALLACAIAGAAESPLYLYGGRGSRDFLGCLNCDAKHPKSVWNELTSYGFKNDYGLWSPFGPHASPYSASSMCNKFSTDAPSIVDGLGKTHWRMSINEYMSGGVCSTAGSEQYCEIARTVCRAKEQTQPIGTPAK